MLKASQVYAAMQNRDFVKPDDIKKLVKPLLSHRMIYYTGAGRKRDDNIFDEILNSIEVPSEEWSMH